MNGTKEKGDAEIISLCSLRVGDAAFGMDTQQIHEVLGASVLQPVPLSHDFVGGVIPYRGDVLLVVCTRRLLGLEPLGKVLNLLVLRDEVENELFGLAVDAVDDVLTVDAASFEANPCTLTAAQKAIFAGAYKLRDGVIVRLEPELLRPSRLAEIQFPGLGIRTAAGVA